MGMIKGDDMSIQDNRFLFIAGVGSMGVALHIRYT